MADKQPSKPTPHTPKPGAKPATPAPGQKQANPPSHTPKTPPQNPKR